MTSPVNLNCPKCRKGVSENQNSICCNDCNNLFHLKCTRIKTKALRNDFTSEFCCFFCKHYQCGKCSLPVFDYQNSICCDSSICDTRFHLKCTGISIHKFNILKSQNKSDFWFCKNCYDPPFSSLSGKQSFVTVF